MEVLFQGIFLRFRSAFSFLLLGIVFTVFSQPRSFFSPSHASIRLMGRVDRSNPEIPRFDWPGILIEALFEGTSCAVEMHGVGESFNIFVDGELRRVLRTDSAEPRIYDLVTGLSDTVHSLLISKRFERKDAIIEFKGLYVDTGRTLCPLPPPPPFRIEFLGASSVNGFGNESGSLRCEQVSDSSNCYYSFGPVTARALDAEYAILAITGKGLVRNWGSPFITSFRAFPEYYSRTLRNQAKSDWDHEKWIPDVVVISLGINDFSTRPNPPRWLFINTYWAFLQMVFEKYPGVDIVCLTSDKEPVRTLVRKLVEEEKSRGVRIHHVAYDPIPLHERGCDWHPNIAAHKKISDKLVAVIKPVLAKKAR